MVKIAVAIYCCFGQTRDYGQQAVALCDWVLNARHLSRFFFLPFAEKSHLTRATFIFSFFWKGAFKNSKTFVNLLQFNIFMNVPLLKRMTMLSLNCTLSIMYFNFYAFLKNFLGVFCKTALFQLKRQSKTL